jgi:hypothetical protein
MQSIKDEQNQRLPKNMTSNKYQACFVATLWQQNLSDKNKYQSSIVMQAFMGN